MMNRWMCIAVLLMSGNISWSQVSETFTKRWETSFGEYSNKVAADPRSDESYYAAFDARKLETEPDYYSVLVKYGCEGEVLWRIGLEAPEGAEDERLVDMAVLSNGEIGLLQEVGKNDLYLHWVSRGGALNTTLHIQVPTASNAWQLLPHPNNRNFLIAMAYDIQNQTRLALLEVNDNGDILTQYVGNEIESGPIGQWRSADEVVLKTGKEVKVVNLNTGQVRGYDVPDANPADGGLYTFNDLIYLTYRDANSNEAHLLRIDDAAGMIDWHVSLGLRNRRGFMYTHVDGIDERPNLMLETGSDRAEVYFVEVEPESASSVRPIIINDTEFISYLGDFDMDNNGKFLYCGSQFSNGADDFSARLDFESSCVRSVASDIVTNRISGTVLETGSFDELTNANFMVNSVQGSEYSDFPPEDYLCRPGLDSLSELFRDTIVCDSILRINHGLSGNYTFNGMPIPETIVITDEGVYQVALERCNTTDRVNFTVEFEDCDCQLYLPNTFTPNGDNLNDVFIPEGMCNLSDYSMLVYDRWGNIVFESQSLFVGWEGNFKGREARPGVYTYIIKFTPQPSNEERIETGTITLLR